jgi:hypothetical protein
MLSEMSRQLLDLEMKGGRSREVKLEIQGINRAIASPKF